MRVHLVDFFDLSNTDCSRNRDEGKQIPHRARAKILARLNRNPSEAVRAIRKISNAIPKKIILNPLEVE